VRIYYVYDGELTDESFYGDDDVAVVRASEALAEVERLRAAGDKLAEAVRDRWTGPDRCDCACCTAAREWAEARL
jgi:hypothetical protein